MATASDAASSSSMADSTTPTLTQANTQNGLISGLVSSQAEIFQQREQDLIRMDKLVEEHFKSYLWKRANILRHLSYRIEQLKVEACDTMLLETQLFKADTIQKLATPVLTPGLPVSKRELDRCEYARSKIQKFADWSEEKLIALAEDTIINTVVPEAAGPPSPQRESDEGTRNPYDNIDLGFLEGSPRRTTE